MLIGGKGFWVPGLQSSVHGLRSSVHGLRSTVFGLRFPGFRVWSSEFWVQCSEFSVLSSRFCGSRLEFFILCSIFNILQVFIIAMHLSTSLISSLIFWRTSVLSCLERSSESVRSFEVLERLSC